MKRIINKILLFGVSLLSASSLFAQQVVPDNYKRVEGFDGFVYSKETQGPNTKGEYTIYLKSFVEGTVTHSDTHIPSDIVLVLDVSGSMNYQMGYASAGNKTWTVSEINSGTFYIRYGNNYYQLIVYNGNIYYNRGGWQNLGNSYTGELFTIDTTTRLTALKEAVGYFLEQVEEDARTNNVDNKVAIVKFATDAFCNSQGQAVSKAIGAADFTETGNHRGATGSEAGYNRDFNYTEVVMGFTSITAANLETTKTQKVNTLNYGGPTAADYAMLKAEALIKSLYNKDDNGNVTTPKRVSNKMVIFFTDGDPTYYSDFNTTVATNAIKTSQTLKALTAYTQSGKSDKVKVYTIGTFAGTPDANTTERFMQRLSYNYPYASGMGTNEGGTGNDNGGYYFLADSKEALIDAFATIGNDVATPTIDLGESTSVVDIVSKSYTIPQGTTHSSVKVYTAACTGRGADNNYTFETDYTKWVPITETCGLNVDPDNGIVTVEDFDFTANLVARNPDGTYRGNQLILEIPIMMDENAVGGHAIQTNGQGSGIRFTDPKDGKEKTIGFESPVINLPTNLEIRKEGLNVGESARFLIQRKWNRPEDPEDTDIDPDTWYNYTTVFVTRRTGQAASGTNAPSVKVVGLHPDFIYRIIEQDWSWSYGITDVYGFNLVDGQEDPVRKNMSNGTAPNYSDNTVLSTSINTNPFIFVNASKQDLDIKVRHAESLVSNEFKNAGSGTATAGVQVNSK